MKCVVSLDITCLFVKIFKKFFHHVWKLILSHRIWYPIRPCTFCCAKDFCAQRNELVFYLIEFRRVEKKARNLKRVVFRLYYTATFTSEKKLIEGINHYTDLFSWIVLFWKKFGKMLYCAISGRSTISMACINRW